MKWINIPDELIAGLSDVRFNSIEVCPEAEGGHIMLDHSIQCAVAEGTHAELMLLIGTESDQQLMDEACEITEHMVNSLR